MNGKGDSPRNCFSQKFRDNWDRIFGGNLGGDLGGDGKSTVHFQGDDVQNGGSTPPTSNFEYEYRGANHEERCQVCSRWKVHANNSSIGVCVDLLMQTPFSHGCKRFVSKQC